MQNTVLFAGFNSIALGKSLVNKLGATFGKSETTQFADGEIRVRILDDVRDKDVLIVQSLYPKTNTAMMQLCFLANVASRNGARRIVAVVPYFSYARQDKAHRTGEAVSSEVIARMIEVSGVNRFVTTEVHSEHVLDYFGIPATNVSALDLVADFIIKKYLQKKEDIILVSPDQDGARRVKKTAQLLGVAHGFVQKERDLDAVDKLKETGGQDVSGNVSSRNVILLDDMISTGSTLVVAAEKVKRQGAKRIFAGSTHGIFAKDPGQVFSNSIIEKVVVTDTITQNKQFEKLEVVSIIDLLAQAIESFF